MSEQKKDDRLKELMSEFLGANEKNEERAPKTSGTPNLDNSKMLEAIDGHRAEIDQLKDELRKLNEQLQKKNSEPVVEKRVVAPEITAMQVVLTRQKEQIGLLRDKQELLRREVDVKRKKRIHAFGYIGWLLLLSNVLLWSILGFWFWNDSQANEPQYSNAVQHADEEEQVFTNAMGDSSEEQKVTARIILEDKPKASTKKGDSIEGLNTVQRAELSVNENDNNLVSHRNSATVQRKESMQSKRKRVAVKRSKAIVKKRKSSTKLSQRKQLAKKKNPKTVVEEPAVRFGD